MRLQMPEPVPPRPDPIPVEDPPPGDDPPVEIPPPVDDPTQLRLRSDLANGRIIAITRPSRK